MHHFGRQPFATVHMDDKMPFHQGTYRTELKYDVNSSFKVVNDMMEKYMKRAVKWKEKREK